MKRNYIYILLLALCASCANMGTGPQGGPKDETPPKLVAETPANGSLNYTGKTIKLEFDEYVILNNLADNLIVSPPQQRPPIVKAIGKKVMVTFEEDLQDSVTYTIDFGNAICDNNEKNPLEGFTFAFATGPVIDSLQISGRLLNAEDLNAMSGISIGVHDNLADSAFSTAPFKRITKTDSEGYFTIRNLRPATYRIYALNDVSKDYRYQPSEGLAFWDTLITPICITTLTHDTIYKSDELTSVQDSLHPNDLIDSSLVTYNSSLVIDTIITRQSSTYGPKDLILFYFNENKQRHYFVRALREEQHYFTLLFSAPQDSLPQIMPIDEDWMQYAVCQHNTTNDTITYWLIDSAAISLDTLAFEMRYLKSDSVYELQPQMDTVRAIYRAPRISDKAREKMAQNKQQPKVELSHNMKSPFEIYEPIRLQFKTPLERIQTDSIHLYQQVDAEHKSVKFNIEPADSAKMTYLLTYPWEAGESYVVEVDSAAFIDLYHNANDAFKAQFKTRGLDEYATLIIKTDPDTVGVVVQLLDDKDKVIKSLRKEEETVRFEYIAPKNYYVRMFIDWNGDGEWTTGDWLTKRQPEPVYYYPYKLTLRANWDFEETIHFLELPQIDQKPDEIFKTIDIKKQK